MNSSVSPRSRLAKGFRNFSLHSNYWLGNYRETIWLIGDGRSGTTWVSNLINHDKRYREMFEPFHPRFVDGMDFLIPHQYVRPGSNHPLLEQMATSVFTGKFTNDRVDEINRARIYRGLLVKDIFANLFACWAYQQFPQLKIILLIRNPFAVALSKYKTRHWFWATEPLELLDQANLREDYLTPFEGLIRETSEKGDYILNQVLIWSIINYVPLRQFSGENIHVTFYEDIYTQPIEETTKIFRYIDPHGHSTRSVVHRGAITQPSRVVGKESNITRGTSPIHSWQNELSSEQVGHGMNILEAFGFGDLFHADGTPNHNIIRNMHKKRA